jgi:hypothetical protein
MFANCGPISWRCIKDGTYNKLSDTLMQQDAEI